MMEDLKDKSVLVFDSGSYTPLAERLSREFGTVKYYSPWEANGFPKSVFDLIGKGIKGIKRVNSWLEHLDEDLYVFTDVYYVAEQNYLRSLGKNVWGSGKTSWMELDRFALREWEDKEGMPVPETHTYEGAEELAKKIKKGEFIKISKYRGDTETFKYYDKERSEIRLKEMELHLGGSVKTFPFLVEEKIDGIEIGSDAYVVNGELPKYQMYGIEIKDSAYLGKVVNLERLPEQIRYINEKLSKVFKKEKTSCHWSNEMRIDKTGEPFLTDMTMRMPCPPYQLHLEMIDNLGEIMYYGSQGAMMQPKYNSRYGAVAIMKSDFAEENWMAVKIPEKSKRWVKLMNWCKIEGVDYALPINGFSEFGAVIGTGNTMREAKENCIKNAEGIEGDSLIIELNELDSAEEQISKMKEYKINF
jgi:hypothetical protein